MKVTIIGHYGNDYIALGSLSLMGERIKHTVNVDYPDRAVATRVMNNIFATYDGSDPKAFLKGLAAKYSGSYLRATEVKEEVSKEYDEEAHPRDEAGRWTAGGANLSAHQKVMINHIAAHGGKIERLNGGFWTGVGSERAQGSGQLSGHVVPTKFTDVRTVRALERQGILERTHEHPEEWKDTRQLKEPPKITDSGSEIEIVAPEGHEFVATETATYPYEYGTPDARYKTRAAAMRQAKADLKHGIRPRVEKAEWDASQHPRDDSGRFGPGGGFTSAVGGEESRYGVIHDVDVQQFSDAKNEYWFSIGDTRAQVRVDDDSLYVDNVYAEKPSEKTMKMLNAMKVFARARGLKSIRATVINEKLGQLLSKVPGMEFIWAGSHHGADQSFGPHVGVYDLPVATMKSFNVEKMDWDESEHPRDEHGRFAIAGGANAGNGHPLYGGSNEMTDQDIAAAKEYDAAPEIGPGAKEAWAKLADDTNKKYEEIAKKVKIEKVTGQPYDSAEAMDADIAKGTFKVTTDNSEHPLWNEDQNWKFRVVHDYIGHYKNGNDFSMAGERKAFLDHAKGIADPDARKAAQVEIHSQASAFTEHHAFQKQKVYLPKVDLAQVSKPEPLKWKSHRISVQAGEYPEAQAEVTQHVTHNGAFTITPSGGMKYAKPQGVRGQPYNHWVWSGYKLEDHRPERKAWEPQSQRHSSVAGAKRAADRRMSQMQKSEWDESKHPRDHGKFSESGGAAGLPEQTYQTNPDPKAFIEARDKSPRGDFFSHLEPGDLSDHKLILNEDGTAGAAVAPDGDIQNVFRLPDKAPRGAGTAAALEAVKNGGKMLDCYDYERKGRPGLPDIYRKAGFVETGRMKFDPTYRPQWGPERRPDVVFMAYVGGDQSASPKSEKYYGPTEWPQAKADSAAIADEKKPRTTRKGVMTYEEESKKIEEKGKIWGKRTHSFTPAEWTLPNGHPRCVRCGDEEPVDGLCIPSLKKWEMMLEAWTEKYAAEWGDRIKVGENMSWIADFHSKCVAKNEACGVRWPICPVGKSDAVAKYITGGNGSFKVHAESGKVLGTHSTRADAEAQLRAIEAHKHGTSKDVQWPVTPDMPGYGKKPIEGEKAPNIEKQTAPDEETTEALSKAFLTVAKGLVYKSEDVMAEPVGQDVYRVEVAGQRMHFKVEKSAVAGEPPIVSELSYFAPDVKLVPVQKSEKQRYTLGAVYAPGESDFHGDTMTEPELEKAAWLFAKKDGLTKRVGLNHQSGTDGAGEIVESYIYRGPVWKFKDASGQEQTIVPGTWMLGVVWQPEGWAKIERRAVTGYSLQGVARKFANGEEV